MGKSSCQLPRAIILHLFSKYSLIQAQVWTISWSFPPGTEIMQGLKGNLLLEEVAY